MVHDKLPNLIALIHGTKMIQFELRVDQPHQQKPHPPNAEESTLGHYVDERNASEDNVENWTKQSKENIHQTGMSTHI